MCGQPPGVPLCDECYGLMREKPDAEAHEFCADCQDLIKRWCFCCGTAAKEPIGEEGVCEDCIKHQGGYDDEAFGEIEDSDEEEG